MEEKLEEIELDIEKLKMGVEEKQSLLNFENAFFIPLFVVLFLLSFAKVYNGFEFYLFILAIILIMIDLVYSLVLYKRLEKRSKKLDRLIELKINRANA